MARASPAIVDRAIRPSRAIRLKVTRSFRRPKQPHVDPEPDAQDSLTRAFYGRSRSGGTWLIETTSKVLGGSLSCWLPSITRACLSSAAATSASTSFRSLWLPDHRDPSLRGDGARARFARGLLRAPCETDPAGRRADAGRDGLAAHHLLNFVREAVSDSIWAAAFGANIQFARQGS